MITFRDIITCYTYRLSNDVSNNFLDKLLNLTEAYTEPNLVKQDVESSLQSVKLELNNNDKETILDDLNNEFLCVGIMFIENNENTLKLLYPQEGIVYGKYNPNTKFIEIYVNDIFFSKFLNDEFNLLANRIIGIITHEDTHNQQINNSNGKVRGIDANLNLSTLEGMKIYLSHYTEIDAHAREAAIYLYNQNYDGSEIKQMINQTIQNKKLVKPLSLCNAFEKYWRFIGQFAYINTNQSKQLKIKIECFHVWKKFLTRLMSYLTSTSRYIYPLNNYKCQIKNLSDHE